MLLSVKRRNRTDRCWSQDYTVWALKNIYCHPRASIFCLNCDVSNKLLWCSLMFKTVGWKLKGYRFKSHKSFIVYYNCVFMKSCIFKYSKAVGSNPTLNSLSTTIVHFMKGYRFKSHKSFIVYYNCVFMKSCIFKYSKAVGLNPTLNSLSTTILHFMKGCRFKSHT